MKLIEQEAFMDDIEKCWHYKNKISRNGEVLLERNRGIMGPRSINGSCTNLGNGKLDESTCGGCLWSSRASFTKTKQTMKRRRRNYSSQYYFNYSSSLFRICFIMFIILSFTYLKGIEATGKQQPTSTFLSTCLPPNYINPSSACTPLSPRLKLIEYNWLASAMNIAVAKIILQEILGVCVDVEYYGVQEALQIMESEGHDKPYVVLEFWKLNYLSSYRKYVLEGKNIGDIGDLGPIGQVVSLVYFTMSIHFKLKYKNKGWYIPNWMALENPFSMNYRYYRTVNKTRFISGSKTWVNFDEEVIQNLQLNLELEYAPENATEKFLVQELTKAQSERKELISYFFTPHQFLSRPDPPQRVSLPPYTDECLSAHNVENHLVDCDFSMTTFSKLQTGAVLSFPVKVQNFLRRMKISTADQISMLGYVSYDSMSKQDAACRWLMSGNNTLKWKSWINETPVVLEKSYAFIISISVASFTIAIILIGLLVLCCGICIRKNSIRKRENRLAPKAAPICIVFTHIQNASLLWTLDSDLMKKVIVIHHKIVRENIRKFRGYEVKTQSDGFMIAFHDPIEAVGCCFAIQNDLLKGNWSEDMLEFPDMKEVKWNNEIIYRGPRVSIGLHFGHDVEAHFDPTTKRYDYFGTTVNQAARTENQSQGGRIYICSDIYEHLKHQIAGSSSCHICHDKVILHKDSIFHFKQLLYSGKIQFENMGSFVLKGLGGNHTLYWVMDTSSPRTGYIQQFELLPHIRDSLSVPLLRDKIDKDRMELKQECASCISDPSKLTLDEKSILLHRLVLWNNSVESEKTQGLDQVYLPNLISNIIDQFILNYPLLTPSPSLTKIMQMIQSQSSPCSPAQHPSIYSSACYSPKCVCCSEQPISSSMNIIHPAISSSSTHLTKKNSVQEEGMANTQLYPLRYSSSLPNRKTSIHMACSEDSIIIESSNESDGGAGFHQSNTHEVTVRESSYPCGIVNQ